MKRNGKYFNQAGNGNVIKQTTGLVNMSVEDLREVLKNAETEGHNQVCLSFNLRKTENGRYVKGNGADVLEKFPANVKPGGISLTTSSYKG